MKRLLSTLLACLMAWGMALSCLPALAGAPLGGEAAATSAPVEAAVEEIEVFLGEDGDATPPPEEAADALTASEEAAVEAPMGAPALAPESGDAESGDAAADPIALTVTKKCTKTVYLGSTYQIEVPGKTIQSCKSGSKKVASVTRSGLVTPKKAGKAKITVKLGKKKRIALTLKVVDPAAPKKVTIAEGSKKTVYVGDVIQLTSVVSPETATQSVKWKSSKKSVASVDAAGLVTTHRAGKATITVTASNKKTAKLKLTVKRPPRSPRPHFMISHAMGGIDGKNYANCLEAFLENYAEGHRAFEVDIECTSDGRLVLWHDWKRKICKDIPKNHQPTFAEFMGAKIFDKYTPMSVEDLLVLMSQYPDITVVTDTKYDDIPTVKRQFRAIVDAARENGVTDVLDHLVVEIYNKKMLSAVRDIYPFRAYVFTLYQMFKKAPSAKQFRDVVAFCAKNGVGTVAMYAKWWKDSYMDIADEYGLKVALYTTNSQSEAQSFFDGGVTSLCTDFLPPLKDTQIIF